MRKRISDYLKRKNAKRFSLFFVLAFVFLIFSKLSNDYKQNIYLKLKLINLDEEIVVENDSLSFITAYVEAKGFTLVPFMFKESKEIKIDAKQDLTTKSEQFVFDVQRHRFMIEDKLGNAYKVLSLKPDTLSLNYSKMASKYVKVTIQEDFSFAAGYDLLGELKADHDSVKLVGPLSELEKIDSINTDILSLSDIKTDINESINLNTSDLKNILVVPNSISISGDVERFTEGTIEVPVTIKNIPNNLNINYFPKSVNVSFYIDLGRFNNIKESDFGIECDFKNVSEKQQYLVPVITKKPDFVKRVAIKQKRIDFIQL